MLLAIGVGSRCKPHVFRFVGVGGPQLLAVDDPVVAVPHRTAAQRSQVGARLRLAVSQRKVSLSPAYRRQELGLLLRRTVREKRARHDGVSDVVGVIRHLGAHQFLKVGDLLRDAARLASILLGPMHPDPSVPAHDARELGIPVPVLERALLVRFAALLSPVLCKPGAELLAEGARRIARTDRRPSHFLSGLGPRSLRCPGQNQLGQFGAGARRAAKPGKVGVHPSKMPGRLVCLSVPHRAQRTNCLHGNVPDRRACKAKRRQTQHAPVPGTGIASLRSALEGQLRAFQADQAIGKLVLDRLELADDAIELPSNLGVLDRQFERALRRAECTSGAGEPHRKDYVGEYGGIDVEARCRNLPAVAIRSVTGP